MKKHIRKIVSLLMAFTILFCSNSRYLFTSVSLAEESKSYIYNEGDFDINKTATKKEDDKYTIALEAKGKKKDVEPPSADIVLVIDKSGSMKDKLDKVKAAAKNFSSNLLNSGNKKIRIAVATFDYSEKSGSTPGASSALKTNFTNNLATITTKINEISSGGGTNTEDGIWRAANILKSSNASKQYVVFFTDGLPTQSHSGGTGHYSLDQYFKDAQREYYSYFTGYNSPTNVSIGGIGAISNNNSSIGRAENITTNPDKVAYKNAKFYSVGLFTNATNSEKAQAINFLKTIQNVIEPSKFGEKYYTQNLNAINGIFNDISNDIKVNINDTIANNVEISDIVTKDFSIVENSWNITDLQGNKINLPSENIVITKTPNGEDKITFKVGDIIAGPNGEGGVKITFDIVPKDVYFYGENIPTNVKADLIYKDPIDGNNYEQIFPIPNVDIDPKKGSITVSKEVSNKEDCEDEFYIKIQGAENSNKNEVYDFTVKNGESKTLNVILKKDDAVVNKPGQHMAVGKYKVIEYNIPNGYELEDIKINDKTLQNNAVFEINKDNPTIDIKVTNKFILNKVSEFNIDKTAKQVEDDIYEITLKVDGKLSYQKTKLESSMDNLTGSIIAENVVIKDIVTKYFTIIEDSWNVTDLDGKDINLPYDKVTIDKSKDEEEISFNIGNIISDANGKGGVLITFKVKTKDSYFGGEDIETNVKADFTYHDPYKNEDKKEEFPIPTVDIPFKKGSITIQKEIVKQNAHGKWVAVADDEINKDDKFSISVVGSETYTVDLGGNEKSSLSFYLKDENTDISNNTDASLNYFTKGRYNIEELVSMNYEQVQLLIDVSTNPDVEKWQVFDGSFTIDKTNPNISIKICNTLTNKKYFNDKSNAVNVFKYNPDGSFIKNIISWIRNK